MKRWPACTRRALLPTSDLPAETLAIWKPLIRDAAELLCSWQEHRRQERVSPHKSRHYVQATRSEAERMDDNDYVPLKKKKPSIVSDLNWARPTSSVEKKLWGFDASTYCQLWRYWILLRPEEGRCSTWIEHWLDYFIVSGLSPICSSWESEQSIRRQCWRMMSATHKLFDIGGSGLPGADEMTKLRIHPGWPAVTSTQQPFPLWEPEKVKIALDVLVGYDVRNDTNLGLTWMELRALLPETWKGNPLPATRPNAGYLGRLIGKQQPSTARITLERLDSMEKVGPDIDPLESEFDDIRSTPLANFIHNQGEKLKRRALTMRQRWKTFELMLRDENAHHAMPVWNARRFRCIRCECLFAVDRLPSVAKQQCKGSLPVDPSLIQQWENKVGHFISWLSTEVALPPLAMDQLERHVDDLAIRDLGDVHVWLGLAPETKKGLLIGRLRQLQARWQGIAKVWAEPRLHKPAFVAVDKRPTSCLCCGAPPPEVAKLRQHLMHECDRSFPLHADDVVVMIRIAERIDHLISGIIAAG